MSIHTRISIFSVLTVLCLLPLSADAEWWDGFGASGIDGGVYCMTGHYEDLYVGGLANRNFKRIVDPPSNLSPESRNKFYHNLAAISIHHPPGSPPKRRNRSRNPELQSARAEPPIRSQQKPRAH